MSEEIKTEKGGISVQTEHIFPIIKKWLYSEKEIFLREIVSNACDAVTKLRRLSSLGEVHDIDDDFRVTVRADKAAGTLTVSDNGIGMTEDELRRYICQIALSGAVDFISKYEGKDEGDIPGIIGHFGLGFYSSFMVSDTVDVITRSYDGSDGVKWVCRESGEYEMTAPYDKAGRGTDVVMHITEAEADFLSESKLREVLEKYCSFMPVEIYLEIVGEEKKEEEKKDGGENEENKEPEAPKPVNDTHPLWQKLPGDCPDEEYEQFYQKVFRDWKKPLFHIHINADYPLNFKGILYFPSISHEYESLEGQVKLYYNQVFVADNIKEVIPEYMLMLRGVLDCPELPLNVSRSYLQNSGYVAKIQSHIVKKVCDKLCGMFTTDREGYEKLWEDLKLFVEYACLRDRKFYDRVKDSLLIPLTDGHFRTVAEYLETAKDKHENVIYYATDKVAQAQYISLFASQGIEVALYDKLLDTQFMNVLEGDKNVKFVRVDAEVADSLRGDGEEYKNEKLVELFKAVSGNDKLTVKFENLRDESVPALFNISEQSRRMEDMMKMYRMSGGEDGGAFAMPLDETLVLNGRSPLVRALGDEAESGGDRAEKTAKQIFTLALLSQRQLTASELRAFLDSSFEMLEGEYGCTVDRPAVKEETGKQECHGGECHDHTCHDDDCHCDDCKDK